jgi:hypothetical protein
LLRSRTGTLLARLTSAGPMLAFAGSPDPPVPPPEEADALKMRTSFSSAPARFGTSLIPNLPFPEFRGSGRATRSWFSCRTMTSRERPRPGPGFVFLRARQPRAHHSAALARYREEGATERHAPLPVPVLESLQPGPVVRHDGAGTARARLDPPPSAAWPGHRAMTLTVRLAGSLGIATVDPCRPVWQRTLPRPRVRRG